MAENEAERTEQPTPKRLEEARKKGQIPRSTELSAAAVILAVGAGLHYLGGYMGTRLNGLMSSSLSLTREQSVDESLMISTLTAEAAHALIACAPILGLTLIVALLAPMLLGGWNMSFEALAPDFTRLNPLNGFGRMFSMNSVVNLAKAFAKFIFLGLVAVLVLKQKYSELMGLGMEPTRVAIAHATSLTGYAFLMLAATLGLIAAIDVPWQLFQHNKQLRMTREEIKEEMKESDGSPEVKGRVRQLQREFSRRRMMQEVPKADVIVTNPTHFAVALKYDEKRMGAPIVVAKGADLVAARIREVATESLVPVFEAPPLARALFKSVEIGAEIPATLYVAVAQVLTYIYQLKTARRDGLQPPTPPDIDPALDETKH
ncbi:MAG: flagellar type III secretion system protein FlhB [Proteobacteria bacterium]|nr:flagellar type III secretion system protein FlhB [Pseudomonadota bacterium]